MIVYHLDRFKLLQEGQVIEYLRTPIHPEDLNQMVYDKYPKGLSHHGDLYYAREIEQQFISDSILENILEYERLLYYPNRPSRFQSIFTSPSLEQLRQWTETSTFKDRDYNICELEFRHQDFALLDSSWLKFNLNKPSFLTTSYRAKKYWSGQESDNPKYELLVQLPVNVIRCIPKSEFVLDH